MCSMWNMEGNVEKLLPEKLDLYVIQQTNGSNFLYTVIYSTNILNETWKNEIVFMHDRKEFLCLLDIIVWVKDKIISNMVCEFVDLQTFSRTSNKT